MREDEVECPVCGEEECLESCPYCEGDEDCEVCGGAGCLSGCLRDDSRSSSPSEEHRGICCACGEERSMVRTGIMLNVKSPVAGCGWGCLACGLSTDGAVAILCDDCAARLERSEGEVDWPRELKWVASSVEQRTPADQVDWSTTHEHDLRFHPEVPSP